MTHEGLVALARRDPGFAPLLPPWMLEDADSVALLGPPVGHAGDLRRFGAKIRAARAGGRALRVTVLGGSISACVLLADPGAECWAARVARWFNARARVSVALRNSAVRATSSSFAAQCLSSLVADDADFVFVEYTANDGYHGNKVDPGALCAGNATAPRLDDMSRLDTPVNRGLERLIRKLLRLPGAPVVVLVQWCALRRPARRARARAVLRVLIMGYRARRGRAAATLQRLLTGANRAAHGAGTRPRCRAPSCRRRASGRPPSATRPRWPATMTSPPPARATHSSTYTPPARRAWPAAATSPPRLSTTCTPTRSATRTWRTPSSSTWSRRCG